jgi:putative transposase
MDNAIIKNLFKTFKSEMFFLKKYNSINQFKQEIIKNYQKLNFKEMSPIQYRAHYYQT